MSPPHFLLCLLSVLREDCRALLTWVQWSIAYFTSLNKTNFSKFCPVSYHWESFVFTCCLVSFQEFFFFLRLVEIPRVQWSAGLLWPKVKDSLLFLPSIVSHAPGHTGRAVQAWSRRPPAVSRHSRVFIMPPHGCMFYNPLLRRKQEGFERVDSFWSLAFCLAQEEQVGEPQRR